MSFRIINWTILVQILLAFSAVVCFANVEGVIISDSLPLHEEELIELDFHEFDGTNSAFCLESDVTKDIEKRGTILEAEYAVLSKLKNLDSDSDCYRTMVRFYRVRNIEDEMADRKKKSKNTKGAVVAVSVTLSLALLCFIVLGLMYSSASNGGMAQ